MRVAEADVGEAVVVDEEPAVAGEEAAVEVDLDLRPLALDAVVVRAQRDRHDAVLERVAEVARDGGADAVGADHDPAAVLGPAPTVLGDHARAVTVELDVAHRPAALEASAGTPRVLEEDVVEAAAVEEDREVRICRALGEPAGQEQAAVHVQVAVLDARLRLGQDVADTAEPVEPVDRLRRETVAADLVPREVGPVEHEGRDAAPGQERGHARPAGPCTDDDHVVDAVRHLRQLPPRAGRGCSSRLSSRRSPRRGRRPAAHRPAASRSARTSRSPSARSTSASA